VIEAYELCKHLVNHGDNKSSVLKIRAYTIAEMSCVALVANAIYKS